MPTLKRGRANDRDAFVDRLKTCAKRAGSLTALAGRAGLRQSTLRGYIIRPTEPPRDVLIRIAEAAKISLPWLVTGDGAMEQSGVLAPEKKVADQADEATREIARAIAKKYSVPEEVAFCRLNGSEELQALEGAMREWATSRPIPIVGESARRNWGALTEDDLQMAAPGSALRDMAVYRIQTDGLKPSFLPGDWALIDTSKPIADQMPHCFTAISGAVEVRVVKIANSKIYLSEPKDSAGFKPSLEFETEQRLLANFQPIGRLVGAIRFVASEKTGKTSPT